MDSESRGSFGKEKIARVNRGPQSRGTHSADGRAAARSTGRRVLVVANVQLDPLDGKPQRFASYDQDGRARADAKVLCSHFHADGAVWLYGQCAVAVVAASAPSVDGNAQTALDRTRTILSARTPILFPIHQFRSNLQLFAIDVGPRRRELDVLQQQFHGIHL